MGSHTRGQLNWLQHNLPEGLVVDSAWLERHHISRQLRRKYVMNGWLLTLARGVYCRPTSSEQPSSLAWQQLVISLNALLNFPVAAGGRTALELQGFSHYVAANGTREAHLFSNEDLPGWVSCVPVNTKLVFHSARNFGANEKLTMSARIELTPLETVMGTRGNAEGPSSSAPVGALARRVVRGGNIIHAEGVPQ